MNPINIHLPVKFKNGWGFCCSWPHVSLSKTILKTTGLLNLIIADPPYGNIVDEEWDKVDQDEDEYSDWMILWTNVCASITSPGGALYVWGGIGKPRFRPLYQYLSKVEWKTDYRIANHITWNKKRAYGVSHNYLFTREELIYLILNKDIKKPKTFYIPLLDQKRGYAGYNKKYPAKSEYLRRTNVWSDVTEILKGKVHVNQKPSRVMEIPIEVHTKKGDWVFDPFAGSGTTALAAMKLERRFVVIESDPKIFGEMVDRIRTEER